MACRRDSPQSRPHCDLRGSPRCAQLESQACGAIRNLICDRSKAAFDSIFFLGARGAVFVAQHQKRHHSGDTRMYGLNHSNSGLTVTEQYQNTQTLVNPTLPAKLHGGKQRKLINFSQFSAGETGEDILYFTWCVSWLPPTSYCWAVFPLLQVEWEAERCDSHLNMRKRTRGGWAIHCDAICCLR